MRPKDILLISPVGFASGWVPSNIGLLASALNANQIEAETFFMCVEFTEKLRTDNPGLLYIDKDIGEWGYSFHEPFFAAKLFGHIRPEKLLQRLVKYKYENKDIYNSYDFRPSGLSDTSLRRYDDFSVKVKNPDVYLNDLITYCGLLEKYLLQRLLDFSMFEYKAVGFSCNSAQFYTGVYATRLIKQEWLPPPFVVFGGPLFQPWNINFYRLNFPDIDYIIEGEAESKLTEVFRQFVTRVVKWERRGDRASVVTHRSCQSILTRSDNNGRVFTWTYESIKSINKDFVFLTWRSKNCSWSHCSFCAEIPGVFQTRPAEKVANEIVSLHKKYGVTHFGFGDPDINGDPKGFERLCELLIIARLPCQFWCEMNARNSTRKLLSKMKLAGFRDFQIGIESFSDKLLKKMQKPASVIDNIKVLKWARDVGIEGIYYNLICNHPGESTDDLRETISNIQTILHLLASPFIVTIAEFELHWPAPVFRIFKNNKEFLHSNYRFFTMSLPPGLRGKTPFFRLKPKLPRVNRLWEEVGQLINDAQSRECGLYYNNDSPSVHIVDHRPKHPINITIDGAMRDVFMFLADAEDLLSTNAIAKRLEGKHSYEVILTTLTDLAKAKLIFSERDRHILLASKAHKGSSLADDHHELVR